MFKIILRSTVVFLCSGFLQAQETTSIQKNWKEDGLKGKVKQLKQDQFLAVIQDGKIVQGQRSPASLMDYYVRNYDEKGNSTDETLFDYKGKIFFQYKFSYDANGKVIQWSQYLADEILEGHTNYKYNDQLVLTEWNHQDAKGKTTATMKYTYDAKGRVLEENGVNIIVEEKWNYVYDDAGNKIEESLYRSGQLKKKYVNIYNSKGLKTEYKLYSGDGTLSQTVTHKYNDSGKPVETNRFKADGVLNVRTTYTYDEQGQLTETKKYKPDGTLGSQEQHQFEYDKQGNWVKNILIKDGVPVNITVREITYY